MMSPLPTSDLARRLGLGLGAVTVAVLVVFVAAFSVHRITPVEGWKTLFDIGGEGNVPTWWNASLLLMVSLTAIGAGVVVGRSNVSGQRAWWVVAAAAAYLSVDEAASIHERLGDLIPSSVDLPTYAWVLPGSIAAVVGAAALVVAGRHLPQPAAGRLGIALAAYGVAAVGVEGFNGWVRQQEDGSMVFTVGTMFEESVEMGAGVYAVAVIVDAFRCRRTPNGIDVIVAELPTVTSHPPIR